jgi:hypothetical protein
VREFDWTSDTYSTRVIDNYNRPLADNGFFCGERIYSIEIINFTRTTSKWRILEGYYDSDGVTIKDKTRSEYYYDYTTITPTPDWLSLDLCEGTDIS